jgi:hypothetical protein
MNGTQLLTLAIQGDFRPYVEEFDGKDLKAEIKPFKAKRSLDSNAYAWVLIGELSKKLRLSKTEVYRNLIKDVGVMDVICIKNDRVSRLQETWSKNGVGWVSDTMPSKIDGCTNVILYYGTSSYNTEEMSIFIDAVVSECKEQGIETMTPAELERLCDAWQ